MKFPYKDRAATIPQERREDLRSIREWLKHQTHLPNISDEFIHQFLHSNYYSVERTKNTIESYFVVRAENPELFGAWKFDEMEPSYIKYEMAGLPKRTPEEGYQVLLYRLKETDPGKFSFQEGLRSFFAFNDVRISEDGPIPGYLVVFDMAGCQLGHLARVTTYMHFIRTFMVYIQECHPVRLKGVHIINTAWFIDKVMSLIKPLLQVELLQIIHFHSSLETLKPFVPLELLPEDYAGQVSKTSQLHDENVKLMKKEYSKWIEENSKLIADLSKRPQKSETDKVMQGSFRTLSID